MTANRNVPISYVLIVITGKQLACEIFVIEPLEHRNASSKRLGVTKKAVEHALLVRCVHGPGTWFWQYFPLSLAGDFLRQLQRPPWPMF